MDTQTRSTGCFGHVRLLREGEYGGDDAKHNVDDENDQKGFLQRSLPRDTCVNVKRTAACAMVSESRHFGTKEDGGVECFEGRFVSLTRERTFHDRESAPLLL